MKFYRGRNHEIPALNTASMPDLIFSILFFFMLVVHMRKNNRTREVSSANGNRAFTNVQQFTYSIHLYRSSNK